MNASKELTYVDLLSDAGFKTVFADRENKDLLIYLINSILLPDVRVSEIVSYLDREQRIETIYGKKTILDLVCLDDEGRTFSVEVQRVSSDTFFERCVYYASGLYHDEIISTEGYDNLRPVYLIAIMEGRLRHGVEGLGIGEAERAAGEAERTAGGAEWTAGGAARTSGEATHRLISHFAFAEKTTGELAPPTINVIFVELGRFGKSLADCTEDRDYLFWWFKHGWEYDNLPENMDTRPFLTSLARACAIAGFRPDKKKYYNSIMKDQRDFNTMLNYKYRVGLEEGREEGLAEGRAEGEASKQYEIALNLLANGLSPELVSECTGLGLEELKAMKG